MVLNFGQNLFGSQGLFKNSPEDNQVLEFQGSRELPKDLIVSTTSSNPRTMADDNAVGTITWSNVDNAKADDTSYADASITSATATHYLKATNFAFSIPTGARIDGIIVDILKVGVGPPIKDPANDSEVKIVKSDGSIGTTNKAIATDWPPNTSERTDTYGGAADLWGETWKASDINDTDFGVVISADRTTTLEGNPDPKVDLITITIHYSI
ncbi:hypothetical protein LCGC14_1911260 [marine sediment metagenome]|uniref:Uncharacterized protein n=1 Tax=marine sediment metagenome TaxID=412755 RepID=A0A0F9FU61_9ZZZZ